MPTMTYSFTEKKRIRKDFSKRPSILEVPFLLVDVELDDQPHIRMVGRLVDGPETPLRIGDRVAVAFEDLSSDIAVPAFTLAGAS